MSLKDIADEQINNLVNDEKAVKDGAGRKCCSHQNAKIEPISASVKTAQGIRTDIRIMQMDCPTEERLIRAKLAEVDGVISLEFKLLNRVLSVVHSDSSLAAILAGIKSLGYTPEINYGDEPLVIEQPKGKYLWLAIAAVIGFASEAIGWFGDYQLIAMLLAGSAIALCGIETYKKGWLSIISLDLNINALMSIAVTGAFILGEWPEAAMVMVLFSLAELIEQNSLQKAGNAIRSLLELSPAMTSVKKEGVFEKIETKRVAKGAIVQVKPGERISLDGIIIKGHSSIDQAPITGESMLVDKNVGDTVFAGTINANGAFEFEVTAITTDTTLAAIIKVVDQAQSNKAPIQRFIDKFARVYTPLVFLIALSIAIIMPLMFAGDWQAWIYKALVLLVIACPCALVISTPVTVVSGLTAAAKRGILIKGGVHLEQGRHIKHIAFDKTGTITQGKPRLIDFNVIDTAQVNKQAYYQQLAMSLASYSDHPVSQAITQSLQETDAKLLPVDEFSAIVGKGIKGSINNEQYYLGNTAMAKQLSLLSAKIAERLSYYEKQGKTLNLLMNDQQVLALVSVADTIKENSKQAIKELTHLQVNTVMLSGDNKYTAQMIGKQVGINNVQAQLLPEDKLAVIERLQKESNNSVVAMVGDGINDAPALATADLGFAMGALGTDTAIETADIALMDDDLRKIPQFIALSKNMHHILVQNISFAIAIKVIFLAITLAGFGDMWMAVFADVGASVLVVANGLRLLKTSA
jgi:Cd2+/Zn2+-exporting ATPase